MVTYQVGKRVSDRTSGGVTEVLGLSLVMGDRGRDIQESWQ